MTVNGIILRFIIGGSVVVMATLIGRRLGGRIGEIFAAYPIFIQLVMAAASSQKLDSLGR